MQRYHFWRCSVYVQNALQLASWLDMSLIRSVFNCVSLSILKLDLNVKHWYKKTLKKTKQNPHTITNKLQV